MKKQVVFISSSKPKTNIEKLDQIENQPNSPEPRNGKTNKGEQPISKNLRNLYRLNSPTKKRKMISTTITAITESDTSPKKKKQKTVPEKYQPNSRSDKYDERDILLTSENSYLRRQKIALESQLIRIQSITDQTEDSIDDYNQMPSRIRHELLEFKKAVEASREKEFNKLGRQLQKLEEQHSIDTQKIITLEGLNEIYWTSLQQKQLQQQNELPSSLDPVLTTKARNEALQVELRELQLEMLRTKERVLKLVEERDEAFDILAKLQSQLDQNQLQQQHQKVQTQQKTEETEDILSKPVFENPNERAKKLEIQLVNIFQELEQLKKKKADHTIPNKLQS